ncbi:MAG: rod-binding protein [Spirochaetales bacterium]|nr:rod-binding protein [Spirochaetales bacterium]
MNISAIQNSYDNIKAARQINSLKSGDKLEATARYSEQELAEMKEACDDFEAIFIKMMLDAMKDTVPESSLIKKNQGEEYFEDMLYDDYAETMSKTDSFGISEAMFRQMTAQNRGGLYS